MTKKTNKKRTSLQSNLYSLDELNLMRSNRMRIENAAVNSDVDIEEDYFDNVYKKGLAELALRR